MYHVSFSHNKIRLTIQMWGEEQAWEQTGGEGRAWMRLGVGNGMGTRSGERGWHGNDAVYDYKNMQSIWMHVEASCGTYHIAGYFQLLNLKMALYLYSRLWNKPWWIFALY